jgi:hypothetical protein
MIARVMSAPATRPAAHWKGPVLLSAMLVSGSLGLLIAFLTTTVAHGRAAGARRDEARPIAASSKGPGSRAGPAAGSR